MENSVIQIISAFVGTLGFSLIFHVAKKRLLPASVGGVLAWGMYLLCLNCFGFNELLCTLIAAMCAQIYSEILARVYKTPTTLFFIPAVVPLIPGSSLYNTMYSAVFQKWDEVKLFGMKTLEGTLGIAMGLSFVSGVLYIMAYRAKQKAEK